MTTSDGYLRLRGEYPDNLEVKDGFIFIDGKKINEAVVQLLKEKALKISVVESLTGGLLSDAFVKVSGSSAVFYEGIVSYAEEAKQERVGVKGETLENFGAVSYETAYEMCKGLSCTPIAISTTGVAGPSGTMLCDIVGRTYIGIRINESVQVVEYTFRGDREEVRRKAINMALYGLYNLIK